MSSYIALLRGINVSGQKKILMADLKQLFLDQGFTDAVTYIQSGNVAFTGTSKKTDGDLGKQFEKAIEKKYGFDVTVVIREKEELRNIIDSNPFLKRKDLIIEKLYVTFLGDAPDKEKAKNIHVEGTSDEFVIKDKTVYLYCPGGYGETKLSNNFFENKLKVKATTRNWKTTLKMLELAESL